jgi:WD40 repeat protein
MDKINIKNKQRSLPIFTKYYRVFIIALLSGFLLEACVTPKKTGDEVLKQQPATAEKKEGLRAELVTQLPHVSQILSVDYAKNHQFFVTGAKDSSIKLWQTDGQLIRTVDVGFWVSGISLFQDDQYALVNSRTGDVAVVKISNGGLVRLPKVKGQINSVAVAPNNRFYAVGVTSGEVIVNTINGKIISRFKLPALKPTKRKIYKNAVVSVDNLTFLQNSAVIVASNYYGELLMWDLRGKLLSHMKLSEMPIKSVASHESNKLVVAFGLPPGNYRDYSRLKLQSLIVDLNKKVNSSTIFNAPPLLDALFSPDGNSIYAIAQAKKTRSLVVFDLHGKLLKQFKLGKNTHGAKQLAISPDGKRVVVIDGKINPTSINVWSPEGDKILRIKKPLETITDIALNPVDMTIASGSYSPRVKFMSIHGKLLGSIWVDSPANTIVFTSDGKKIIIGTNKNIQIWDYQTRKRLQTIKSQKNGTGSLSISDDGQYVAAVGGAGKLRILRKHNNRYITVNDMKLGKSRLATVAMSRDGSAMAVGLIREGLKYIDNTGNTLWEVKARQSRDQQGRLQRSSRVCAISYSDSGKMIASLTRDSVIVYTTEGSKLAKLPVGSRHNICDVKFINNDKHLLITSGRNIALWDWKTRKEVALYKGHTSTVTSLGYVAGTTLFVSGSSDSHLRFWNLQSGYSAAVVVEKGEWVIYDHYGYFDSSKNGGKILNYSKDLKTYPVDQFALYYNRPDIIYSRLGLASKEYASHLYTQHKRRINKAFINESFLSPDISVPEIDLIRKERVGDRLKLHLTMKDNNANLKYYQMYNNNVPLFGRTGKSVGGKSASVTESVELLAGNNHIEVSVVNENGIESYRISTNEVLRKKKPANLYFVGLGVSKFQLADLNLKYAAKDVTDLSKHITSKYKNYAKVFTRHYLNEQVNKSVLSDIESFLSQSTQHDTVILFIAGHGAYERNTLSEYYYVTHDTVPEKLQATAISWSSIEDLLYTIKPNKKLVLMDTCESGEMDIANQIYAFKIAKEKGFYARANQILGDIKNYKRERRKYLYNKDRYIYNDLVKGSGALVFSSSAGGEMSFESEKLENGFFTDALIAALSDKSKRADKDKNGVITINELVEFVSFTVSKQTGGLQNPTVDRGNPKQDFVFR